MRSILCKTAKLSSQENLCELHPRVCLGGELRVKYAVCECGVKIEIVQDLCRIKYSIDKHAELHGKTKAGRKASKEERLRIEAQLAEKVIKTIIGADTTEVSLGKTPTVQ